MATIRDRSYSTVDVSSTEFWSRTAVERELSFARLRAEEPVSWQRRPTAG